MDKKFRTYISIDLKSFFASVECVERGLDPLSTNLVVADISRTEKTICLAVSPSLKAYGIGGRARLFEVVQRVREVNDNRRSAVRTRLVGKSYSDSMLKAHPEMELDYIVASPQMSHYIDFSNRIYKIYLKYVSEEDIFVYSIDEVFMDVTDYLSIYKMTANELAMTMIRDVLHTTGITATAGIGTNMYLCKVAMDIVAKHIPADENGVRVAELDEMSYRRLLWNHRPLTSFWRVGRGIAEKLEMYGIDTMGKLARFSLEHEDFLYNMFGVNAELLIDHAWGWEPCTMQAVKAYRPETNSVCSGQVLQQPYSFDKARVVAQEMADALSLDLADKHLVTDQLVLTVSYDTETLSDASISARYQGELKKDYYGRMAPKHSHGTVNLPSFSSSSYLLTGELCKLFDRIVHRDLMVRRLNLTANHVVNESLQKNSFNPLQMELFCDYEQQERQRMEEEIAIKKERRTQETLLDIKKKFGKNSILKGLNFKEGATAKERNQQIGGHKA